MRFAREAREELFAHPPWDPYFTPFLTVKRTVLAFWEVLSVKWSPPPLFSDPLRYTVNILSNIRGPAGCLTVRGVPRALAIGEAGPHTHFPTY